MIRERNGRNNGKDCFWRRNKEYVDKMKDFKPSVWPAEESARCQSKRR